MTDQPLHSGEYVSLRDYIDSRIESVKGQIAAQEKTNERAIQVANDTMQHRLATLNEFRASLEDQTREYALKSNLESLRIEHNIKIESLQRQMNMVAGALIAVQALIAIAFAMWQLLGG